MDGQFVHVDEAVAIAMSLIKGADSMDKAVAREWAYLGLRNIGPTNAWFKECTLYPNEQRSFCKPSDMWKPIDIALFSADGCEIKYVYQGLGHRIHTHQVPNPPIIESQNNVITTQRFPVDLSEDPHFFHLGSNGGSVAAAYIKYWQLPIDDEGLPKIPEGQALAVALFIRWMWSIKENDNQSDRQISRADYIAERAKCRAEANLPHGINMTQIGKEFTSMLGTTPNFKRF